MRCTKPFSTFLALLWVSRLLLIVCFFPDVMSHIGWGGEQITIYKGVETFP